MSHTLTTADWNRSADRKSYVRHLCVFLDDKVYAATFTCSKSIEKGAWMWSMTVVVDGALMNVDSLATYDRLSEVKCSAELAGARGFHQVDGRWIPKGSTRDFPDGIVVLP